MEQRESSDISMSHHLKVNFDENDIDEERMNMGHYNKPCVDMFTRK